MPQKCLPVLDASCGIVSEPPCRNAKDCGGPGSNQVIRKNEALQHTSRHIDKSHATLPRAHQNRNLPRVFDTTLISCETVAVETAKSQSSCSFLILDPYFVRQGCWGPMEITTIPQFLTLRPCWGLLEIAIFSLFLTLDTHCAREGGVSW